ncbi:Disease resistance protein (CC-NBS-LRR class) family protein [Rhynchospora pubera]|uniref:Disease resistance protein (CC-NBS-LRR class) family protein n=1 Tax=Rhynchospora pubera TaxID=906938 RepID=A0AAV8BQE7_9POAL|nr:Disease resistance protein (CC-NBS-LRR class) family protein [Rhynchospora pubera]
MAVRPIPTFSEPTTVGFEALTNYSFKDAVLGKTKPRAQVVAIAGPRGVGKTYLVKEIYTSDEVQKQFTVLVWLCARHVMSLVKPEVLAYIGEQLDIKNYINLESRIGDILRNNRCLAVIDGLNSDETCDNDKFLVDILNLLPSSLKYNGSTVLVTSRTKCGECGRILMQYEVGPLSDEESLKVLLRAAFPKYPSELGCPAGELTYDLAMKFVRICEGLPWPLRFLGGLLSERPWKAVLQTIFQSINRRMSFVDFAMRYRNLPSHDIRAAFLYFLTFPEDAEILAESLVHWLEVENIVENHRQGKRILEYLVGRTMIEVTEWYSEGSIKCCQLHDPLLRSLAIHEAKEKRFVYIYGTQIFFDLFDPHIRFSYIQVKQYHRYPAKTMCVAQAADASCIFNFGEAFPLETPLMSDRVLEIDGTKNMEEVARVVRKMRNIKYLGLKNLGLLPDILETIGSDRAPETLVVRDTTKENLSINELPNIGSLKYLFLRNTIVREIPNIPESVCTLNVSGTPTETLPQSSCPNLKSLLLRNTKVRQIPESFPNLENLDVRDTFVRSLPKSLWSNGRLRSVLASNTLQHLDGPPSTAKLTHLETLKTVDVSKTWRTKVPKLDESHFKKLGLSYFQNAANPYCAVNWNIITRLLSTLPYLSSLMIEGSNVPARIIDVSTCPSYEGLLRKLWVGGSRSLFSLTAINMPRWLSTLTFENLEFNEDPMPMLEKLQYLESLQLRWLLYSDQTKKMICSNGGFPRLEKLQLYHVSGLEEWSVQEEAFPRITHVAIQSCKELKDLSGHLVDSRTPLKELHLHAMPPGLTRKFSDRSFVKITEN